MSKPDTRQSNTSITKRIPELDGIRGLAILLVILYHYIAVPIPADASSGYVFVQQIFSNCWSGVDLFFVLSGFLIAGILIDNRLTKNYFQVFYIRRVNRIFPLYYFLLFLFIVLQHYGPKWGLFSENLFVNPLPSAPYFIFLQNFTMAAHGDFGNEFLAMTWSLAIEEQFYLFLPLLVRLSLPQRLPLNFIFFIGLSLILRETLGGNGSFHGFVLTPWRLDSLFLGCLLAHIVRTSKVINILKTHLTWVKIAFSFLLLFFAYSSITERIGSLDHLFAFGLLYTILISLVLADSTNFLARFFRQPALKQIGLYSFGIYLFHQLVNGILHDLFFKRPPSIHNAPTVMVTLLAFLVTYLMAMGTYRAFEKRFIAFGHKHHYYNK